MKIREFVLAITLKAIHRQGTKKFIANREEQIWSEIYRLKEQILALQKNVAVSNSDIKELKFLLGTTEIG